MSRRLYEIAEDLERFADALENEEIPEEAIADTLESLEMEARDKIGGILSLYKDYFAEAKKIKEEVDNLVKRQKAYTRKAERLLEYIGVCLGRMGADGFENERHRLTYRKSEAVELTNEKAFFDWARENYPGAIITTEKAALSEIKEAIQDGVNVPGAQIVTRLNPQVK